MAKAAPGRSGARVHGEREPLALLEKHSVSVRRGRVDIHSDQAIVERFNRTLSERLFGHQYAQEMPLQSEGDRQRSVEWVARLPAAVAALNNEVTHLLARKPGDAIQMPHVEAKPSDVIPGRLVGLAEQRLSSPEGGVRYLYQPGELEGGRRRATDTVWSIETFQIAHSQIQAGQPVMYWLRDGPKWSFVREELQVVPWDTELPPEGVL